MSHDASRRTLLLVEDEAPVARALVRMLAATGLEVVHVATGDAAIEQLRTRSFDIVLSDLSLPGATGIEVLAAARAAGPTMPLILMSGSPTAASTRAADALGVVAYLAKPMDRAELAYALQRAAQPLTSSVPERAASSLRSLHPSLSLPALRA